MLQFNDPQEILGATLDGRWKLTRVVGQGGLGVVFEARSADSGETRAIKVLRPEFGDEPEIVQRFLDEIRPSVRIDHPGVAHVYEAATAADGTPYLVMELLTGQPLSSRMNRGRIPVDQAAGITLNILGALSAAHAAGVVHRDLKPGNVFMVGDPDKGTEVKVLDFGIALVVDAAGGMQRKTRTGMMLGTPGYMSPEQIRSIKQADARADLWSVGIIFQEMLTGVPAFEADNDFARVTKVLTGAPVPIDSIAPQYAHWVPFFARALAKNPAERFQSAREMAHAVDSVARNGRMPDAPADNQGTKPTQVIPSVGPASPATQPGAQAAGHHHPSLPPQPSIPQQSVPPYSHSASYAPSAPVPHGGPYAPPTPARRFGGDTAVSAGLAGAPPPGSGPAVEVVNVPRRPLSVPLALVLIIVALALVVGFVAGLLVGRL